MPDILIQIFVFLAAASIGSFLNVCIYRIPAGLSIVSPPSSCPSCNARIRARDNIPIVGYLILGARCRNCKARISAQYPAVELLTAVLALLLYNKYGLSVDFFIYSVFVSALVVISFIDLEHQIIPDVISLPAIPAGFLASFVLMSPGYLGSLVGILLGGGTLLALAVGYGWITGREGLGGGDIKLLAMLGAFLGWQAVIFILFAASFSGAIIGVATIALSKKGARTPIPFGPFLAASAVLYIFAGERLIGLYLAALWTV